MPFGIFEHDGRRFWMSEGNVRSAQVIQAEVEAKRRDPKVLKDFLARNATYDSPPLEDQFFATQQATAESAKAEAALSAGGPEVTEPEPEAP